MGAGWATVSSSPANDNYLGNRLLYGAVDDKLAGIVTSGMVVIFFKKVLLWWLISTAAGLFSLAFFSLLGVSRMGQVLSVLFFLATFVVFFITFRAPISGWTFTLDGKASAAGSAFAQICTSLRRRESPVDVSGKEITGGLVRGKRNYLRLRQRPFSAYVSVFPIGRDLFIGWTIWWELKPLVMIWTWLAHQFGSSYFELVVRSDDALAFREIVHNATREGVDIAALGIEVQLPTAFGWDIPFEDEPHTR